MQAIYNSDAFYYVLLAGFIIYGIYYLYGIIKYFRKSQAARKRFTEMHRREEIRAYNGYRIWIILFVIFVGYSLWSAFTIQDGSEQGPWFRLAFLLVAIVLAGQGILAVVKRRILFADDGFAYEDEAFRWQSVISMAENAKKVSKATLNKSFWRWFYGNLTCFSHEHMCLTGFRYAWLVWCTR